MLLLFFEKKKIKNKKNSFFETVGGIRGLGAILLISLAFLSALMIPLF